MKKLLNDKSIYNIIKCIFIILFATIFLLLIFVDTNLKYNYANDTKIDNWICLGILVFIFIMIFIVNRKKKLNDNITNIIEKKGKLIIMLMFILLFIVQLIILNNIYFKTGWDASHLFATAEHYAKTDVFKNSMYYLQYPYFDVYPNNIFLTSIFGILIKIALSFNILEVHKFLVILSIILVDIAGIVMVKTIGNFTSKKTLKILGATIFVLFIGLSPWYIIPYSDTYSILFPISVLYNYTKENKKFHNYLLIGLFSFLGYLIKPTNIIILIAIFILEFFKVLFNILKNPKIMLKNFIGIFLGILIVFLFNTQLLKLINYTSDNTYALSPYHYIMMGLNTKTTGTFSTTDVLNSLSINNYDNRIKYNQNVISDRLSEFSFNSFIEFYSKKLLVNFNDGTFSWGKEGLFYLSETNNSSPLSNCLKDIFYSYGNKYIFFSSIMQIIWIFILLTILIGTSLKNVNYKYCTIYLTLIGLTLFLLLFEARARYLYIYAPYFIILSIISIDVIYCKLKKYL